MSSPFLELLALARGEPASGAVLLAQMRRVAARLPDQEAEDHVQDQLTDLLTRPEIYVDRIVAGKPRLVAILAGHHDPEAITSADRLLVAYLRTSLVRKHLSARRDDRLHARLDARRLSDAVSAGDLIEVAGDRDDPASFSELGVPAVDPTAAEAARLVTRAWGAMELAVDQVAAEHPASRDLFEELCALARGDFELRARIAAQTADPEAARRRYDAKTRAHSRLRGKVGDALEALEASGALSAEDADLARHVLEQVLTRRPIASPSRVSRVENSP